jgi:DNA polymerase-3 subunit delta
MDSLAFLKNAARQKVQPVYVLHGDEAFLKRQARAALQRLVLGGGDPSFALTVYPGDKAELSAVLDDLATLPFLCPRRLVVVEDADPFVTANRAALEQYVARPVPTGVLALDVRTWPATTKLAKLVDAAATLVCKAPTTQRLPEWCAHQAEFAHGKQLTAEAARLLVDLVGAELGLLDQELAKLAAYAGERGRIEAADVDQLVGSSRTETVWKIFDAVAAGKPAEALAVLDQLLGQREEPIRILGAFSMQMRRLAAAHRLTQQGKSLSAALEQLGVNAWAQRGCEQLLRHLGPRRAGQLLGWLVEADLGLKGSSQLPPRTLLERLVVRLARKSEKSAG